LAGQIEQPEGTDEEERQCRVGDSVVEQKCEGPKMVAGGERKGDDKRRGRECSLLQNIVTFSIKLAACLALVYLYNAFVVYQIDERFQEAVVRVKRIELENDKLREIISTSLLGSEQLLQAQQVASRQRSQQQASLAALAARMSSTNASRLSRRRRKREIVRSNYDAFGREPTDELEPDEEELEQDLLPNTVYNNESNNNNNNDSAPHQDEDDYPQPAELATKRHSSASSASSTSESAEDNDWLYDYLMGNTQLERPRDRPPASAKPAQRSRQKACFCPPGKCAPV